MPFPCLGGTTGADLLVLIISRPTVEGALARSQLRQTWAHWDSPSCVVRFRYVLGRPPDRASDEVRLLAAASREREALVVNASEGYSLLSHKVFAAFTLAVERESFAYLLKTDDDSYVCIGGMLRWLMGAQGRDGAATEWIYAGTPLAQRCAGRDLMPLFGQIGQARGSHASLTPLLSRLTHPPPPAPIPPPPHPNPPPEPPHPHPTPPHPTMSHAPILPLLAPIALNCSSRAFSPAGVWRRPLQTWLADAEADDGWVRLRARASSHSTRRATLPNAQPTRLR